MVDFYKKILKKIAHFQVTHPIYAVLILFTLSVMIWGGVSKVQTVASLEQMMPKNIEEISAFNVLRDNYLGQDMIAIVISIDRDSSYEMGINDIRDKEVYDYIKRLDDILSKETDVLEVYSYANVIDQFGGTENYENIIEDEKVKSLIGEFVSSDLSTTMILINTDVAANDDRMNLLTTKVKEITEDVGEPRGVKVDFTGTPVIQQKLGTLISSDRNSTQWISTLFVLLITMVIFRSFSSSIVPILVVFVSVNWLYGTMGYTNLPISTLAGGVAAMVIGIGIDFAIHIMNKFKYERAQGLSIRDSIEEAVVSTGMALTVTSLTTIVAFLAFLFGVMPEMGRFGMLMAIGIFYSLVFSIFGLPALLVIEERLLYAIKGKARFGIEGEFHLEGGEKDACKVSE